MAPRPTMRNKGSANASRAATDVSVIFAGNIIGVVKMITLVALNAMDMIYTITHYQCRQNKNNTDRTNQTAQNHYMPLTIRYLAAISANASARLQIPSPSLVSTAPHSVIVSRVSQYQPNTSASSVLPGNRRAHSSREGVCITAPYDRSMYHRAPKSGGGACVTAALGHTALCARMRYAEGWRQDGGGESIGTAV